MIDEALKIRMVEFENNQQSTRKILDELVLLVKEMNKGLYGDAKNKHTGVIDRQYLLEQKLVTVNQRIFDIEEKNRTQDTAIDAKKSANGTWFNWGKTAIRIAIELVIIYGILKGVVSVDALHK